MAGRPDPRRTQPQDAMLQGTRARVIDREIDVDVLELDAHLQPIGDTAPEAGEHEEGDDPAENGDQGDDRPALRRRRMPEERIAHDGQERGKGIELQQRPPARP